MIFKVFKIHVFVVLFVLLTGSRLVFAQTYKIQLKTFDACGTYETQCKIENKKCFSTLKFPFEKDGKYAQIDANISIVDQSAIINFQSQGQFLSTERQRKKSFSEGLGEFSLEPQIVKLYFPNPVTKNDNERNLVILIRDPNAYLTSVSIDIKPVSGRE